jgi:hypothetical protein
MVMAMQTKAIRKTMSAMPSSLAARTSCVDRNERNDNMQLAASKTEVTPVMSSIIVAAPVLDIRMEVSTTKQNPNRLDEVLRICDDLFEFI